MIIKIQGTQENNLKDIDVNIKDGLTVITGVSGSEKTSLIFDTLYKEARCRFLKAFSVSKDDMKLNPANVSSISGLGHTVAFSQNVLNRNPNSILTSTMGLISLLKVLYARFGERRCRVYSTKLVVIREDKILAKISGF